MLILRLGVGRGVFFGGEMGVGLVFVVEGKIEYRRGRRKEKGGGGIPRWDFFRGGEGIFDG